MVTKLNYQNNPKRPPLLPSEAENNGPQPSRRLPKSREITSRYLSTSSSSSISTTSSSNTSTSTTYSSSSNRSSSPMLTRIPVRTPVRDSGSVKRSQSVDRRRPMTPVQNSGSVKQVLMNSSSRSLSVSFQGESISIPVNKAKPAPATGSVRKGTPERKKMTSDFVTPERSKVPVDLRTPVRDRSDQHRWPGRSKSLNSSFLTRSMDCGTIDKPKFDKPKFGSGSVTNSSVKKSVIDVYHRARIESKLKPQTDNDELALASDSESVSSGSISGTHKLQILDSALGANVPQGRAGPRGIVVPARFWQETNNRIRRGPERCSSVEKNGNMKAVGNKKFLIDSSPRTSPRGVPPSRGLVSPHRGGLRPASPNKALAAPSVNSPLRGMPSPARTRNGAVGSIANRDNSCIMPSILSFAADARRGRVGENRIVDAHELRLLYNRHQQWRFVNARAEAALRAQTTTAERNLYNAWLTTLKLRHSVKSKRVQLQLLRQNVKLHSVLKGQGPGLEIWSMIDGEHCNSLSGAICALEASTIRLPVVEGARAEVQNVKDAISSAVDVMQAMGSSMCSLLPKVERVDSMVYELADVEANERALLDQCKDLLSSMTVLQVKECSLRTHLLQLKDPVSCSTT
ncbi:QWRF motif-containing protein 2-like [Lycium barbarum]|uniref:QWRF motif-containing protein 2-like n=1 Tax=Lycium barbarum TaxID=112863 RepID=UPI00293F2D8E|nr:QWRF motif-containing protein 2-like [Lycium barbarum]